MWYYNLPAGSPALDEVLTDANGVVHGNTVPAGLVRPEVWRRHLAGALPRMARPFADLLAATRDPFVTKVNDALCEAARPVFRDGRVVLVGDALAAFRPHLAIATEQAARHCLALGRVWEGGLPLDRWGREARAHGKSMWLASRVLGAFGLGRWWELLMVACVYVAFLVRLKLGRE